MCVCVCVCVCVCKTTGFVWGFYFVDFEGSISAMEKKRVSGMTTHSTMMVYLGIPNPGHVPQFAWTLIAVLYKFLYDNRAIRTLCKN